MREAAAWWVLLTGVWLLTLGAVTLPELTAAVVLALPCALAARAARRALDGHWRFAASRFRSVPLRAARDTVAVIRARGPGSWEREGVPRAEQGAATVAIGLAPGTLVADVDGAELLVHRLVPRRSGESR